MVKDSERQLFICSHCLRDVTDEKERMVCPACGNFYHSECWGKNYGCAVISCSQKNILLNPFYQSSVPVRDLLTHIEYFINIRKYDEAITECRRILNIDSGNLDAKVFYNRAVSLMKTRDKILESAEESYAKKQYKASALFYKEYLNFCDDEERKFISSKIKYLEELLPSMKRRSAAVNTLYFFIILLMLASAGFYLYRFVYLREETEFAEIERNDNFENIKTMETQILKYENFLIEYPEGKMKEQTNLKIVLFSSSMAAKTVKDDWRVANIYLKKINPELYPKTYYDTEKLIYEQAKSEIISLITDAKNSDRQKNYSDARQKIDKSLAIIDNFNGFEIEKERKRLLDARNLLSRKSGLQVKLGEIEREITTNTVYLKEIDPELEKIDFKNIYCRIIKKDKDLIIVKSIENKKLYAIRGLSKEYQPGEELEISGYEGKKVKISDDADNEIFLPLIISLKSNNSQYEEDEKSVILKKLDYLRSQKSRIDSTLNTGIL